MRVIFDDLVNVSFVLAVDGDGLLREVFVFVDPPLRRGADGVNLFAEWRHYADIFKQRHRNVL